MMKRQQYPYSFSMNAPPKDTGRMSLNEILRERHKKRKNKHEALEAEIAAALAEISVHKDTYRVFFQRALHNVRNAEKRNNPAMRDAAMRELKSAYGLYHYLSSFEDAFRTLESELAIQRLAGDLNNVVGELGKIRVSKRAVDFDHLTESILRNIRMGEIASLDTMTNSLIEKTMQATNAASMPDEFVDDLLNGSISLDSACSKVSPMSTEEILNGIPDFNALLNKINSALRK